MASIATKPKPRTPAITRFRRMIEGPRETFDMECAKSDGVRFAERSKAPRLPLMEDGIACCRLNRVCINESNDVP